MQFQVKFTTNSSVEPVINVPQRDIGLAGARRARRAAGVPDLVLDRICGFYPARRDNIIYVTVSEVTATQAGHFEHSNTVTVVVPPRALDQFVYTEPEVELDRETGEVKRVTWVSKFDNNALIDVWAMSGFPLEWDLEMPSEDSED